jgi:tetratricopeptide (TPR) repeat protein
VTERDPRRLPDDEVARLEARIAADSDDAEAREKLVGHYLRVSIRERGDGPASDRLTEHARWVVEHRPGSQAARWTRFHPRRYRNPIEQAELARLWLRHVEDQPDDAGVLENAGRYWSSSDPKKAIELLERARDLAPARLGLTAEIAHLRTRLARRGGADAVRAAARETVTDIDELLQRLSPGAEPTVPPELLGPFMEAAFECEDYDRAESAARALLDRADREPPSWNTGNRRFHAHTWLGRIALRHGDVPAALDHLRGSAQRNPGSPQLGSFGPNMSLAKELLERGEVDAVVAFFESCKSFWHKPRLDEWIAIARAGLGAR